MVADGGSPGGRGRGPRDRRPHAIRPTARRRDGLGPGSSRWSADRASGSPGARGRVDRHGGRASLRRLRALPPPLAGGRSPPVAARAGARSRPRPGSLAPPVLWSERIPAARPTPGADSTPSCPGWRATARTGIASTGMGRRACPTALHFGTLSPVVLAERVEAVGGASAERFLAEVAWRDFYAHRLAAEAADGAARPPTRSPGVTTRTRSRPGRRAGPGTRPSTPACASWPPRAGCRTGPA